MPAARGVTAEQRDGLFMSSSDVASNTVPQPIAPGLVRACSSICQACAALWQHLHSPFLHAQDLEILKGYVPGFNGVLGHECVARVIECTSQPDLVGESRHKKSTAQLKSRRPSGCDRKALAARAQFRGVTMHAL